MKTDMKKTLFIAVLLSLIWHSGLPFISAKPAVDGKELKLGEAKVWYLDRAGFAIQTSKRFLLFDYYNPNPA